VPRRRAMMMVSRRWQRTAAPHVMTTNPDAPAFLPGPGVSHRGNGDARCSGQQDDCENSSHTCSTKIWTESRPADASSGAKKPARDFTPRPVSSGAKTRQILGYFFEVLETFAAALTAGFLAAFPPASAIAFGFAADLAVVFVFFGAVSVSAVLGLAAVLRATLASVFASALDLAFGALTLSSTAGVAFDLVLTGFFAGGAATASASFPSGGRMTGEGSCSSKAHAFSQYSVDRPSGRPSASHRWYACKRSFSSKDLLCIPLTISHVRAFMLQERRSACERAVRRIECAGCPRDSFGQCARLDLATL
jgi:hypothetical protein